MIKYTAIPFYSKDCKLRNLKTKFNSDDFTVETKRRILQFYARGWGDINQQQTIFNNEQGLLMFFSCSGHGGFMLFSSVEIENSGASLLCSHKDYNNYKSAPFYIYEYEEDCGWAFLKKELSQKNWEKWKAKMQKHYSAPQNFDESAEKTLKWLEEINCK